VKKLLVFAILLAVAAIAARRLREASATSA
jgi:hypothetical protein